MLFEVEREKGKGKSIFLELVVALFLSVGFCVFLSETVSIFYC
jgi:hypothetical protein